jgi:ribosomal protein S18 acetylase RimI-like enzyme
VRDHGASSFVIRDRVDSDMDACVALATAVQLVDGYPSFVGDGGLEAFVAPPDVLGAWVALTAGTVVGHAMLRPRSAPPSVALAASALGVEEDQLGFVARLMVHPAHQRRGIARCLLDTVVAEARRRDLTAVLDVVVSSVAAVELYEASGWVRLGDTSLPMRTGGELSLHVFAKP